MELHPNLRGLEPLLGTWTGNGQGRYPTIKDFEYTEETTFSHTGKPFLAYSQRTWLSDKPAHVETGYLRAVGDGRVEIVVAIPTGQVEIGTGASQADDGGLNVHTDAKVLCTPSAKQVNRIVRSLHVRGDVLDYTMDMEAVGQRLAVHLEGRLERQA